MAKNKHARSGQNPAPTQATQYANQRPVEVDREAYEMAIETLQRLQSLLTYISANGAVALGALTADEQKDVWLVTLSLANDAERMLENGSVK